MKHGFKSKTVLAASALLITTGLYANCGGGKCGMGQGSAKCGAQKMQGKYCDMKNFDHHKKYRSHHKGNSSRFIIGAVYALDLSDEQKKSIDSYMQEYQKNRSRVFDAFTNDSFDKQAYIKARMKTKEDMIEAKANLLEKIYSTLTKEQKVQLKKELTGFEKIKEERFGKGCYDKSCNGGR